MNDRTRCIDHPSQAACALVSDFIFYAVHRLLKEQAVLVERLSRQNATTQSVDFFPHRFYHQFSGIVLKKHK
jgi:hypothetical protein